VTSSQKTETIEGERRAQLLRVVPELFAPGTLLYVGACYRRTQFLPELLGAGREVTILEIWPPYAAHFAGRDDLKVVCGDVCEVTKLSLPHQVYDAAFWWHGPEHIERSDLEGALAGLEQVARLVVVGCPWGHSRQEARDGNKHQRHVSTLEPQDFEVLGYRVDAIKGPGGGSYSNILAVKGAAG